MGIETGWSYDKLGGGKYRVRLIDKKGKTTSNAEFLMLPDVRWGALKARLETEVEILRGERVGYELDETTRKGVYRVTLLDGQGRKTKKAAEFEMAAKFKQASLERRAQKEAKKLREE